MSSVSIPIGVLDGTGVMPAPRFVAPEGSKIILNVNDQERWREGRFARVERWVDSLADHTFKTKVFDLPAEQADALMRAHDMAVLENSLEEQAYRDAQAKRNVCIYNDAVRYPPIRHLLEPGIREALNKLEATLDAAIEEVGGGKGAFVRTSALSPKDALIASVKLEVELKKAVEKHMEEFPEATLEEQDTHDVAAYARLLSWTGKVNNGEEALELFIASKRTYADLSNTRLQASNGADSSASDDALVRLVVREWEDIDPAYEFRAFVVNSRITTIQEYSTYTYVPDIVAKKILIRDKIVQYFENEIRDKLEAEVDVPLIYTLDFYVSPDLSKIFLIEVNEGPPLAGTHYFDLKNPDDVLMIEGQISDEGGKPFIRVQEEPKRWGNWVFGHIRYLVDQTRGRDLSWTESDPTWGVNLSMAPGRRVSVACVCNVCDAVYERADMYACITCDYDNPANEHILCKDCFHAGKGKSKNRRQVVHKSSKKLPEASLSSSASSSSSSKGSTDYGKDEEVEQTDGKEHKWQEPIDFAALNSEMKLESSKESKEKALENQPQNNWCTIL